MQANANERPATIDCGSLLLSNALCINVSPTEQPSAPRLSFSSVVRAT